MDQEAALCRISAYQHKTSKCFWSLLSDNDMFIHMKRTTLILHPTLDTELRQRAAAEGRTLTEVVERALRLGLRAIDPERRRRVALPSYDLGPFLLDPAERGAFAEPIRRPRPARES